MAFQSGGVSFSRHKTATTPPKPNYSPAASEDLTPWSPSASDPWDHNKVRHLSRRAGFGLPPEHADKLVQVGHKLAIDIYLIVPHQTIPERGTYLLKSGEVINMSLYNHQVAAWLYLMTNSPWQLQEKMALMWHDHFSTGISVVRYAELMGRQVNVFRRHALGKFRDLVASVAIDPAMLYFLDNRLSRVGRPNENFARELKELHTMGVGGGYTETDIQESARCFTGWTNILDFAYFRVNYHDFGVKRVLGRVIDNRNLGRTQAAIVKDGLDVIDACLAHPSTAKYVARKIWEYFVYENPSQALVDKLAARWRKDGYDIRALMETIFRSKAFYSQRAMRGLIKNPAEYVVGMMRQTATNEEKIWYTRVTNRFLQMGLPLMNYAGPEGLPEGQAYINSQNIINRINFAMEMIERRVQPHLSYLRSRLDPEREILRAKLDTKTPDAIVDHFLDIFVDGDVPKAVRDALVRYMTQTNTGTRTWSYNTSQALKNRELREKVAGLIHMIHGLPEAHIN